MHYDAGRLQSDGASVRRRLQNVIIHESDGFKKTVMLPQYGLPITAETDKGLVYIDHSNNRLKIYVPRDPRQRQRCYSTQLPKALVSFLEIEDRTATEVFRLACLLQEDVIENVLDDNGILYADADVPDSPTEATEENSLDGDTLTFDRTSSDDVDRFFETRSQQGPLTGLGTATSTLQHADHEPEPSISHTTHRQAASLPRVSVLPHSSEPSADTTSVPALYDSQYIRLLGHVIMLARQAAFPQQSDSAPTIARVNGSSTQGLASGIRSGNQLAHDIKTGAAGELFVCAPFPFPSFHLSSSSQIITTNKLYVTDANTNNRGGRYSSSSHSRTCQTLHAKTGEAMCAKRLMSIPSTWTLNHGVVLKQRI